MTLNKTEIFTELFIQLEKSFLAATDAAEGARQLATHEQSKPETQYDTVGLEASYLAHGHSQRAADLANALDDWKSLRNKVFDDESKIDAGALVEIIDSDHVSKTFLIGNYSGGLKLDASSDDINGINKTSDYITVITLSSPLGRALKHKQLSDEIQHPVNKDLILEVVTIC